MKFRIGEFSNLASIMLDGNEYMWQPSDIWKDSSPVLFPFIGGAFLEYDYDGMKYYLNNKHGFARNTKPVIIHDSDNLKIFELSSNKDTKKLYPFDFVFRVTYEMEGNKIIIRYDVTNKDDRDMLFTIGYHPSFLLPNDYSDSYILLDSVKSLDKIVLDGPYTTDRYKNIGISDKIYLTDDMFSEDAIILSGNTTNSSTLVTKDYRIRVNHKDIPYIAYWKKPGARFICIEPWHNLPAKRDNMYLNDSNFLSLKKGKSFSSKIEIEVLI